MDGRVGPNVLPTLGARRDDRRAATLANSISAKILYSDNVSLSKVLNTKIMIDMIIGVWGPVRGPLLSMLPGSLIIKVGSVLRSSWNEG